MIRATHTTTYLYSEPVSICHTEVHLTPRAGPHQRLLEHSISVEPTPISVSARKDYFGNDVTYFSIEEPHQTLTMTAESRLELIEAPSVEPRATPPWEEVSAAARRHADAAGFESYPFVLESPRVAGGPEFAAYAAQSFEAHRPILDAALDLCHRIHAEFHYDRRATTVSTPVAEVLESRRGVCQDFAHFMIACLRSLGVPARYVSGYLAGDDMIGNEASHAWVSVFCPGAGWIDLDPTNDSLANGHHITLAWGRDYSDVTPLKGVVFGGGTHMLDVSVDVAAIDEASAL